ncbi:MAG TPA: FAD-dependent tricarballylate dehydrogenase TcuA [Bryobacteraceae bacterium]|nr:FAD-dependent tricarballylate dehydrogenase TcuA [Bryobacteraceae bacterium]
MTESLRIFDVLIAGGGNAALCAALSAAELGAAVAIVECAPKEFRGGNSRHTRNLRCLSDRYQEPEYFEDLCRVTGGETDEELARLVIRGSRSGADWMRAQGVRFQPTLSGTLHLDRTNAFFLGGGKAVLNAYYAEAQRRGVHIFYNAEVVDLNIVDGHFESARVMLDGQPVVIRAKAFVAAAGGFESNLEWLKEIWGEAADSFLIRGTPYNRGAVLKLLLDRGALPVGDPAQCHAVAIDARAPKFDSGIVTRLDCLPLGIAVNQRAERFYDEGEDLWPKRYAIWGRLVAQQPGQIAYSIIDSKASGKFVPSVFPPVQGGTIRELAEKLGLAADALEATVQGFNQAVRPGAFDHTALDDCRTHGLAPDKTHWARPLDTPPFLGYPLRPGITFTYLGVKVNRDAQVLMSDGRPARNILAAGEIMAGNILGKGYLAGIGMAIGTVFGRIAGPEAAHLAK